MDILTIDQLDQIPYRKNYLVLRFNGLYGDLLHGMIRIQDVLHIYPDHDWIVIHDYGDYNRVLSAIDLFQPWIINGKLKYYIHNPSGQAGRIQPSLVKKLLDFGIDKYKIFDCFVFQNKPRIITPPCTGISIPKVKDVNKAVIFRYSGYHSHFFGRNRPIEEWIHIERKLLDRGYTVFLLGKDDTMPNPNHLVDLRGKFTIRQLLQFVSNSSICISVTTFLYVWTQFVCPTLILSEEADITSLTRFWKLTNNLHIANINNSQYIYSIYEFIDHVRNYDSKYFSSCNYSQ